MALERRADAERNDRHRVPVGERDDRCDVFGALAVDDRVRRRRIDRRLVAAVLLAHRQRGRAALAELRLQRRDHGGGNRARLDARQEIGGQGCVHGCLHGV
jgi:hypothetical protein